MKVWPHPLDPDGPDPWWLRASYVSGGVMMAVSTIMMLVQGIAWIIRALGW